MSIASFFRLLIFLCGLAVNPVQAQQVYLFQNQATIDFFSQAGGDHQRVMAVWNQTLARLKIVSQQVNSTQLLQLVGLPKSPLARVLVLPSAVVLNAAERNAVTALENQGWSVLGTWAVGTRDEKLDWTGYSFIQQRFNTTVVGDHDLSKTQGWFFLPVGESPVTHSLLAGERVYLQNLPDRLLLLKADKQSQIAARGGDWTRQASMGADNAGLMTFSEKAVSRSVFIGVPETAWSAAQAQFDRLLSDSLAWLAREARVVKGVWPHPFQSALLIEMDTEDQFANANNLMTQLEERGLVGTFYSLTSEAVKHPEVIKRITEKHEMAYHAEVHDGFKGLSPQQQEARLSQMKRQLIAANKNTATAVGFRAPLESFDANTEIALRKLGFKHHAGSPSSSEAALPTFSAAEHSLPVQQKLVVLPRTMLDDVNFFNLGIADPVKTEQLLIAGANDIHQLRGFGLLSVHSQYFAAGMPLQKAFVPLLESITKPSRQMWVTSASKIEAWWRAREQVSLSSRSDAAGIQISLNNTGSAIKQFKLVVMLPTVQSNVVVDRKNVQIERLDSARVALVWHQLDPGVSNLLVGFR